MENPDDRLYTKEHEWIKIDGDVGTVGVTYLAQKLLTDVVFVELPEVGKEVKAMEPMCVLESVKSVSDVFAPADGIVVEVNSELEASPELVNESPFDKGWIAKIRVKSEPDLMKKAEYDDFSKDH